MEDIELMELEIPRILKTIQRKAELTIQSEEDSSGVLRYGMLSLVNTIHAMRFAGCDNELCARAIDASFESLSKIFLMVNNGSYETKDEYQSIKNIYKKEIVKKILVEDFSDIISAVFFNPKK